MDPQGSNQPADEAPQKVTNPADPSLDFSGDTHDETPPRADVDEILRRKRKAREYKACYPCRQRKVKCDQQVPCKTCLGECNAPSAVRSLSILALPMLFKFGSVLQPVASFLSALPCTI